MKKCGGNKKEKKGKYPDINSESKKILKILEMSKKIE